MERRAKAPAALAALGVVFGDIGTSPLYAFGQSFSAGYAPTRENVLGIVSLIVWALVIVVCVKYVAFMLRADYEGEGGILALLAQVAGGGAKSDAMPVVLGGVALVALFGAAALYGDGLITPAISVVSAMEGLTTWSKGAERFVVPLAAIVLLLLFALQSRGTGRVGKLFGPIILLWFAAIGVAGIVAIVQTPQVLAAVLPTHAWTFLVHNGLRSILIFGAIVLCVTGAEALYADLSHFGRAPITIAWYAAAFPALVLNYIGQAAHAMVGAHTSASGSNTFYALYPQGLVVPMVVLSTAATVIASQALISGAFSLTHQATQLGLAPRFLTIHTSKEARGQIYLPTVNVLLALGCLTLVVTFRSSNALGGAYGLAVSMTMLATTIAYASLARKRFKWPVFAVIPLIVLFLSWDVPFLVGNLSKIRAGGWMPLVIAIVLFTLFLTWNRGRRAIMEFVDQKSMPLEEYLQMTRDAKYSEGAAVFFTLEQRGIPAALRNLWVREHIVREVVILLTIVHAGRPTVPENDMLQIEALSPHLIRARASFGFTQHPDMNAIVSGLKKRCGDVALDDLIYYFPYPTITQAAQKPRMPGWQRLLYRWMQRNSRSRSEALGLPADRVIWFGVNVPL